MVVITRVGANVSVGFRRVCRPESCDTGAGESGHDSGALLDYHRPLLLVSGDNRLPGGFANESETSLRGASAGDVLAAGTEGTGRCPENEDSYGGVYEE